jgi:hypothetical protein
MSVAVLLLITIFLLLVALLNIWHYRRRSLMTPEARNLEDEETRIERYIW